MYSCIIFLLTEGTARILSYSHNTEMSIEVRVASKESNEDPQILPRKVQSKARSWVVRSMQKVLCLSAARWLMPQSIATVIVASIAVEVAGFSVSQLTCTFCLSLFIKMFSYVFWPWMTLSLCRYSLPCLIIYWSFSELLEQLYVVTMASSVMAYFCNFMLKLDIRSVE